LYTDFRGGGCCCCAIATAIAIAIAAPPHLFFPQDDDEFTGSHELQNELAIFMVASPFHEEQHRE